MPIFCDESGSNGNDLLEVIQPYFTYAALNITNEEASAMVLHLKATYKLQGNDLKGKNLVRSTNGQKALIDLYNRYGHQVKIIFHHKKYALSCKFFEYIFEPVISEVNQFFYQRDFQKFIANFLYEIVSTKGQSAETIFVKFQELMKGSDLKGIFDTLSASVDSNKIVRQIFGFATMHRETILSELSFLGGAQPWVLDLAQSALYDLLIKWSQVLPELTVMCDESKPLRHLVEDNSLFEPGQEVRYWNPLGEGEIPANFKLTSPVEFSTSKASHGLQLADLFASSAFYFLKNPDADFSKQLAPHLSPIFSASKDRCIMPQPEIYLQEKNPSYKFGRDALQQLYSLSLKGKKNVGTIFRNTFMQKQISKYY